MYYFLRKLLFLLPPETAHYFTLNILRKLARTPAGVAILTKIYPPVRNQQPVMVAGLKFMNRVGVAAGMDKNAEYYDALGMLGFGFVEIGTVTPMPQMGNAKPRLFRLPADNALINRMGFNNQGADVAAYRLKKNRPAGLIIGGNIGKNKDTPNHRAVIDYERCFETLFEVVDYFVVNVSSPNTPDLRALQDKPALENILVHLQKINNSKPAPKPIFLKIAPDLSTAQLDDIISLIHQTKLAGVVATNTTIARPTTLRTPASIIEKMGAGGLSGAPVRHQSTEVIRYLRKNLDKNVAIIGVGGIYTPADALEKIQAGADLVQLYTGFVYEGAGLIHRINNAIKSKE